MTVVSSAWTWCESFCSVGGDFLLGGSLSVFHHLCDEDIDTECDSGLINPGRLSPGVAHGPAGADVPPVQIIALSNRLRILLCLTGKQQHLACLFPRGLLNHICNDSRWRNLVKPCRCEPSRERGSKPQLSEDVSELQPHCEGSSSVAGISPLSCPPPPSHSD